MGIVSRMTKPKALGSEMERMLRVAFGGGTSTSAGKAVSNDSAMRQATVYSCINVLSRVIGTLPCHMMGRDGKSRYIASDFHLYNLIHDMPNEWMTAPEFWGMAISHQALRGNFYALKSRSAFNRKIKELIPFVPDAIQKIVQNPDYSLTYHCVFPDGSRQEVPGSEIMHLKGMTLNGYMGVNPIEYIRESIGLGLATEEFGARYFGTGMHPGVIIEHPGKLSAPASKNLKESFGDAYAGLGKSHRLMLLEEGMKANTVSIKPEDSQFLDTRKYQKSEIVDIFFGLPLSIMGSGDSTPTFASAEQFSIQFVVYALMPWIYSMEKAMYRDLLTVQERRKYYAKFNAAGLQRGSFKDQMDGFATAITKEILNPNEVREMLDFNPYSGGEVYAPRTSTTKETSTE